jgi:hypothetical protein
MAAGATGQPMGEPRVPEPRRGKAGLRPRDRVRVRGAAPWRGCSSDRAGRDAHKRGYSFAPGPRCPAGYPLRLGCPDLKRNDRAKTAGRMNMSMPISVKVRVSIQTLCLRHSARLE